MWQLQRVICSRRWFGDAVATRLSVFDTERQQQATALAARRRVPLTVAVGAQSIEAAAFETTPAVCMSYISDRDITTTILFCNFICLLACLSRQYWVR